VEEALQTIEGILALTKILPPILIKDSSSIDKR
jgi:hypothetical protein